MAQRSERLKLVWDVAHRKEQAAMEALQRTRQQLDQQRAQLQNLQDYQAQYLSGLKSAMQGAMSVQNLQSYHGFVEQLAGAITQQEQVVKHAEVAFDQQRKGWLACREKCKSLDDLITRCRAEEAIARDKKLEKRMEDDLNARRARLTR